MSIKSLMEEYTFQRIYKDLFEGSEIEYNGEVIWIKTMDLYNDKITLIPSNNKANKPSVELEPRKNEIVIEVSDRKSTRLNSSHRFT